jgi:hypothetical protein
MADYNRINPVYGYYSPLYVSKPTTFARAAAYPGKGQPYGFNDVKVGNIHTSKPAGKTSGMEYKITVRDRRGSLWPDSQDYGL